MLRHALLLLLAAALPQSFAVRLLPCGVLLEKEYVLTTQEEYILRCQLFIPAGHRLNISAGVTILALGSDGSIPALVIERGGAIYALGTADKPITFTAFDEQTPSSVTVSTDSQVSTELVVGRRGKWGGVVMLGRAPVNAPGGTSTVEGLHGPLYGGRDSRYGGDDPHDSSGALRFVRIWHAGAVVAQDDEINGLTLGGVGDGTVLDHVEVAYSLDDGVELFGGTVNLRHLSVLFAVSRRCRRRACMSSLAAAAPYAHRGASRQRLMAVALPDRGVRPRAMTASTSTRAIRARASSSS